MLRPTPRFTSAAGTAGLSAAEKDLTMSRTRNHPRAGNRAAGFSLVELIIVVAVLGILGAIVVPQFSNASNKSRTSALQVDLKSMRTQIGLYIAQHKGDPPSLADFEDQMTMASNAAGGTAAPHTPGFPFGPYMAEIPRNPFTNTNTIGNGAAESSAWYYDEGTGAFHANHSDDALAF